MPSTYGISSTEESIKKYPLEFFPKGNTGKFLNRKIRYDYSYEMASFAELLNPKPKAYYIVGFYSDRKAFSKATTANYILKIFKQLTQESKPAFLAQVLYHPQVSEQVKETLLTTLFSKNNVWISSSRFSIIEYNRTTVLTNPMWPIAPYGLKPTYRADWCYKVLAYVYNHMELRTISTTLTAQLQHSGKSLATVIDVLATKIAFYDDKTLEYLFATNFAPIQYFIEKMPDSEETANFILNKSEIIREEIESWWEEEDEGESYQKQATVIVVNKLKTAAPEKYAELPDSWVEKIIFNKNYITT